MTYKELQTALKELREQGHVVPALNSKKEVLEAAYNKILATIAPTAEVAEIVKIEPATEIEPAIRVIQVVAYAIALIKFLGINLAPYIKKGLRIAVTTAAWIFYKWILPKLILGAYLVGVWGLTIALKIVRRGREVAIA